MTRKVALNVNGLPAQTISISYTQYHPNVELHTVEEKAEYERQTKQCSNKAHIDTHEIYLNVDNLSRMTRDATTRYSNWYGVRTVNVFVESAFVTYTALNARGERTMSHILPIGSVEKVDVHYKDPNKRKPKRLFQPSDELADGRRIYDLDATIAEDLK